MNRNDTVFYAVGDIHGRDDLLIELQHHIREFHALCHASRKPHIVYIGDYIDGGAHSVAVIDRLMRGLDGFESTCLLGNHEAMMLDCLDTNDTHVWRNWVSNGGEETLGDLGLSFRFGAFDRAILKTALGEDRIDWLRKRPLFARYGSYLFVHAGIAPGVPLGKQRREDLLWIRSRFLESDCDHGFTVVHGHTSVDQAEVTKNRICIDTGATSNGTLTAAVLDGEKAPLFLCAKAEPGKGANVS